MAKNNIWTTEKEIRQQLEKKWEQGFFLTMLFANETVFPLKLKFVKPTSSEITTQFDQVRKWVFELSQISFIRIEWKNIKHRIQGEQSLPDSIYVDNLETVLHTLKKGKIYQQFQQIIGITRRENATLLSWVARYPFKALEFAEQWQSLLNIVQWVKNNPKPYIYLRQVDIPHIHSKFIEQHRSILSELFELALPEEQIDTNYPSSQFTLRYGFLEKPKMVRFRNLDSKRSVFPHILQSDLSLDSISFSQLTPEIRRVIIVENEINFLSLPEVPDCWAIFGAGYGWKALAEANWLQSCQIYYWGDIDTHGFAILNQLRTILPKTVSFLMDESTLLSNRSSWSKEDKPQIAHLLHLTDTERNLYQALCTNEFGLSVRLEQEFIPFSQVQNTLQQLFQITYKG